ncbi:MAG: sirohydrochlorin cobaltochelatase [Candidatus Vecturithrix sp.]|nr:sirohydrochlorin cobaltochelatase [Candidatus Vecturithrix sp.]
MTKCFIFSISIVCILFSVFAIISPTSAEAGKKAILVVSFGTSYADTREITIEACEKAIKEAFPEYETRRAFTSNIIINILKERDNILVDTPQEAVEKLQAEGFTEVIAQPLHVIPGEEFHDVVTMVKQYESAFETIRLGMPLLATTDDYMAAVDAIAAQLPDMRDNEAVVFMGHGTHHPANAIYPALERVFEDKGFGQVFVGTVEGYPELDHVIQRLRLHEIGKVTLMPFMLVAGDHAQNDMAGDEEDSWKMQLKKEGFLVETYLHGLGENAEIQKIYVQHVQNAIAGEQEGGHGH